MDAELHMALLGAPHITRAGAPVSGFISGKAHALLYYLAVTGRPHSRQALATLLWGEMPEADARANLRVTLSNLRQLVGSHLFITRDTVAFNRDHPYRLDVEAFQRTLETLDAASLAKDIASVRDAVALYRGDFLEGWYVRDTLAFEDWVAMQRVRLRQLVLQALYLLAVHATTHGAYAAGIAYATRLLALEPWEEEAHRQLMLLLFLNGQRGAALAQYDTCRRILSDELGVVPAEETTGLYERIRAAARTEYTEERRTAAAVPFVGRSAEYAWLVRQCEAVRQGGGRITLVEGAAGMGKTRLAEEILRYAHGCGFMLLCGRCYELGSDVPYLPIAEALRSAVVQGEDAEAGVPAVPARKLSPVWLAELARLLPELREIYPGLPAATNAQDETARQRLFEAVARFVQTLIGGEAGSRDRSGRPIVIFLDDVHWLDQATADLLGYLLLRLHNLPLWFLGTYRPEMPGTNYPFQMLRGALARAERATFMRLPPLSSTAVAQIAQALPGLDGERATQLADYLARVSEGNPAALGQILRELERHRQDTGEAMLPIALPAQNLGPVEDTRGAGRMPSLRGPGRARAGRRTCVEFRPNRSDARASRRGGRRTER